MSRAPKKPTADKQAKPAAKPAPAKPASAKPAAKPAPAKPAGGPTIAFVTTCRGRLHHLQQTMPLMAAEQPDELIVVDYGCPDGTGDWVEANYPQAKVVRAKGKERFNLCDARNTGAAVATADWLYFVDADIRLQPGMLAKLRPMLAPGGFYMPKWIVDTPIDIWGSCICLRSVYEQLDGYDEVFEGWGADDEDFYHRMENAGIERRYYPPEWVDPIVHDDTERSVVTRNKYVNEATNACYGMAKREISRLRGLNGNLPLQDRRQLMQHVRPVVAKWFASYSPDPLTVHFLVRQARPHGLAAQITVTGETRIAVTLTSLPTRRRYARPTPPETIPKKLPDPGPR